MKSPQSYPGLPEKKRLYSTKGDVIYDPAAEKY
jgi:hypothetical protein